MTKNVKMNDFPTLKIEKFYYFCVFNLFFVCLNLFFSIMILNLDKHFVSVQNLNIHFQFIEFCFHCLLHLAQFGYFSLHLVEFGSHHFKLILISSFFIKISILIKYFTIIYSLQHEETRISPPLRFSERFQILIQHNLSHFCSSET